MTACEPISCDYCGDTKWVGSDACPQCCKCEQQGELGASPSFAPSGGSANLARIPKSEGTNVHFSSQTVEWPTPKWLFDALHAEFGFTLDPCSTHENAKCPKHYTRSENGLLKTWQREVVWMNPPYGTEIAAWMKKAHDAAMNDGATVVCLVPSRTDTAWWHEVAMKHEIRLLRGRLTFEGGKYSAPFPSAVVVMRPRSFRLVSGAEAPAPDSQNH